ncbi:MAG: HAMP domain-containing histidine kinase [Bacteroidales bacterium]|nr:HAMP domain-containing histidine kinase [Bacteroidales bacterium]
MMNSKKHVFPDHLASVEKTAYRNNEKKKLQDQTSIIADQGKAQEKDFRSRLKELEKINTHLEKLVEQYAKKLMDVAATNTKFISIIAHDLRSPFISIIYALDLVRNSLNDHSINEIENIIDQASGNANNTLTLLDDLLAWIFSQNKEKSFNPVKINVQELVMDEIKCASTSAVQKQLSLHYSIAPDLNVAADIQMVKTILRNLIGNAVKYTNSGGEISISASENNQFVEIAVRDNGIGISPGAQKSLFKLDTIYSTKGTNNEKGTGLGLLLCKEFVEIHGGYIRVESEPGKGSKFTFTLPHYI